MFKQIVTSQYEYMQPQINAFTSPQPQYGPAVTSQQPPFISAIATQPPNVQNVPHSSVSTAAINSPGLATPVFVMPPNMGAWNNGLYPASDPMVCFTLHYTS